MKKALLHKALLLGGGGEGPKVRGEFRQGLTEAEGTGLHESAAKEDREEAANGSVAPTLDGMGG